MARTLLLLARTFCPRYIPLQRRSYSEEFQGRLFNISRGRISVNSYSDTSINDPKKRLLSPEPNSLWGTSLILSIITLNPWWIIQSPTSLTLLAFAAKSCSDTSFINIGYIFRKISHLKTCFFWKTCYFQKNNVMHTDIYASHGMT